MIRVWYHSNCYDGFGAGWSVRNYLMSQNVCVDNETEVEFRPCSYGYSVPAYTKDDEIYIVDFSFPREDLITINQVAKKLLVLDHHKTAQKNCEGLDFAIFDMDRSGAGLAWDHLMKRKRPLLIDLIEDRDLWTFKKEGSKELHAYLCMQPFDFEGWDAIATTLEEEPDFIWAKGKVLLDAQSAEVKKVCKGSWETFFEGHRVAVVNTSAHWSEVGELLLEQNPDAKFAMSFTVFNDQVMYSLRSRDDFDVSEVAKKFGGGGHKQAAGFKNIGFLILKEIQEGKI